MEIIIQSHGKSFVIGRQGGGMAFFFTQAETQECAPYWEQKGETSSYNLMDPERDYLAIEENRNQFRS